MRYSISIMVLCTIRPVSQTCYVPARTDDSTDIVNLHAPQPKLPPAPRCPAPSPNYTHRENIESHIRSYFFSERQGMKRYVLHGPSGAGKTELVLNLVDKHCYTKEPENKEYLPFALSTAIRSNLTGSRRLSGSMPQPTKPSKSHSKLLGYREV